MVISQLFFFKHTCHSLSLPLFPSRSLSVCLYVSFFLLTWYLSDLSWSLFTFLLLLFYRLLNPIPSIHISYLKWWDWRRTKNRNAEKIFPQFWQLFNKLFIYLFIKCYSLKCKMQIYCVYVCRSGRIAPACWIFWIQLNRRKVN